jgi:S1-C subfamily serine protease
MVAVLALTACASVQQSSQGDIHESAVIITNIAQHHGGTGIVLRSSQSSSLVLTNSHVCKVVENGGLVSGTAGKFMVSAYKHSQKNDLCLLKVEGDLKANTIVAKNAPVPYRSSAIVSGHPALMPNIITRGHFSGRQVIPIMVGIKPCTADDANDPSKGLACMLIGGIPLIREFDSVLVSATIMPGSSGSGVYNSKNELSGVVFAGAGELGYGWTVPYQSLQDFLYSEAGTLSYKLPNNIVDIFGQSQGRNQTEEVLFQRLHKVCASTDREKLSAICEATKTDATWYK